MNDFSSTLKKMLNASGKLISKAAKTGGKAIAAAAKVTAKGVSKAANSTANATRYKIDELSHTRQRDELIAQLGTKVYELHKREYILPAEVGEVLAQIDTLEMELATLRSEHQAAKDAAALERNAAKAAKAAEKTAAKVNQAVEESTAVVEVELPSLEAEIPDADPIHPETEVPTLQVELPDEAVEIEKELPTLNVVEE